MESWADTSTFFAAKHPERMAGLAIVDIGPEHDPRGTTRIRMEVMQRGDGSFAEPGEYGMETTGELGGLWRRIGRPPNRVCGAVFSTGSIAWSGSLATDKYDNDVAKLTTNVLLRFAQPEPFEVPEDVEGPKGLPEVASGGLPNVDGLVEQLATGEDTE